MYITQSPMQLGWSVQAARAQYKLINELLRCLAVLKQLCILEYKLIFFSCRS